MNLAETLGRQCSEEVFQLGYRTAALIDSAHIQIVDIEKDPATGAQDHFREKFGFAQLSLRAAGILRRILQKDLPFEYLLNSMNIPDDSAQRLFCVRQRQRIGKMHARYIAPRQMIRDQVRLESKHQLAKLLQMLVLRWIDGADARIRFHATTGDSDGRSSSDPNAAARG